MLQNDGQIPTDMEPSLIVFVDTDDVVTQRKHMGQQGYQRTRQADAEILLHVVP